MSPDTKDTTHPEDVLQEEAKTHIETRVKALLNEETDKKILALLINKDKTLSSAFEGLEKHITDHFGAEALPEVEKIVEASVGENVVNEYSLCTLKELSEDEKKPKNVAPENLRGELQKTVNEIMAIAIRNNSKFVFKTLDDLVNENLDKNPWLSKEQSAGLDQIGAGASEIKKIVSSFDVEPQLKAFKEANSIKDQNEALNKILETLKTLPTKAESSISDEQIKQITEHKNNIETTVNALKNAPNSFTQEHQNLLKRILVIKQTARKAQEDTPERWEKVKEQGGKYYWYTDTTKGFEAWQEGYSGNALLGDTLVGIKHPLKELSTEDKRAYENCKQKEKDEKKKFNLILLKISNISIDTKKASLDGNYIQNQAHSFFNTLSDDYKKIFARFEGLLKNGSYDEALCVKKVTSYLNSMFGAKGRFIETAEALDENEKEHLLDTLDYAEDIVAQLFPDSLKPRDKSLILLKKTIITRGENGTEKLLYLKYMHLKKTSHPAIRDEDMLSFIDYMLQLEKNGVTSNVRFTAKGVQPAPGEWKVSEHTAEFARDMSIYREFMAYMRKKYPDQTPGQLRGRLKQMCEEYKSDSSEGQKLYQELSDEKTGMKHFDTAIIAELYKALLLFEKTPIHLRQWKFSETHKGDIEETADIKDEDMKKLRDDYARKRRGVRAFFIKHTKDPELHTARDAYIDGYRQRIFRAVTSDANIQNAAIYEDAERDRFRTELTAKVIEELLKERKELFSKELEVHRGSTWQRLKTWFRAHPYIRLGVGAGSLLGIGAAGALGAPALAIPFILARMGMWQLAWEGGWEGIQNNFGKTRGDRLRRSARRSGAMGIQNAREVLAAHSTLAIGTRPGFSNAAPPHVTDLNNFYRSQAGEAVWNRYTQHLTDTITAALQALPPHALKEEIIAEAIRIGREEEIKFMKDVENRERHMRMTDVLKKVTGMATGLVLFGKDLVPHRPPVDVPPPVVTPPPEPPVVTPPPVEPPVVTPPPVEPPVVIPPVEPPVIPPHVEPPVVTPPHVEPPVVIPPVEPPIGDITFRMIESMPGDPDPGVFQAIPYKLGLLPSESHELHRYMLSNHTLSGMEHLNPFLNRPGIVDSYGDFQQGINFVRGGETFQIPDAQGFVNKIREITGNRLSSDEIIRKLAS